MHLAADGDTVWGAGVNGKVPFEAITARNLDVRAVRGPLSAEVLEKFGHFVPPVYGDPGLLVPKLFGICKSVEPSIDVTYLPNLHDFRHWKGLRGLLSPRTDYETVIRTIAASKHVVASSLHGIVIAEALGVEVSLVRPVEEDLLKYRDYFLGTGRDLPYVNETTDKAPAHAIAPVRFDTAALEAQFPIDLWSKGDATNSTSLRAK